MCNLLQQQRYFTMATAKSVFEHAATSDTSPKLTKKASKWDKPKPVPPPAVNRDADNAETLADLELPPPAYTKNMLAKFQSMQQSDGPLMSDSRVESSKPKKVHAAACFIVSLGEPAYLHSLRPLPSSRHHRSNGDCLEGKRENYQVCSVQYCVQQLCTVQCTHI